MLVNNTSTNKIKENITNADYNASWNTSKPEIKISEVSYLDFCNKGNLDDRKRELATFLANISHETTGGGFNEKTKTTGLYWREELSYSTSGKIRIYITSFYIPLPLLVNLTTEEALYN